jgi:hypothetical protein
MKTYGAVGVFLTSAVVWRWVVSFTPRPLCPRGKSPRYPFDRRLGGPRSRSGWCGEEKNLALRGIDPGPSSPSLCRLSYPGSQLYTLQLYDLVIRDVPGEKVNILETTVWTILRKKFIWMCVLFRAVSDIWGAVFWIWRPIFFFPAFLWAITSAKLTLHADLHASDISALRWREGKDCAPYSKYCEPNIENRSE